MSVEKMMTTANAGVLSAESLDSSVMRAVPGSQTGAMLDKKSGLNKGKKNKKTNKVEKCGSKNKK